MKIGDEAVLKIIDAKKEDVYEVENVNTGDLGRLKVKGNFKISKSGTVNAWVIGIDKDLQQYIYGNAYFGKSSISAKISKRYIDVITRLYKDDKSINTDDISNLKGMVNRCLRKNQWDWYTTYEYLGYPESNIMHAFIKDCIFLRNMLKEGKRDQISSFKEKYYFIFSSMLYHLGEKLEDKIDDLSIPIKNFDEKLWSKLSYDSRKNIKMLEHIEKKTSIYVLMHYFVTLEQEFYSNLITPFIEQCDERLKWEYCDDKYLKKMHDILVGKRYTSLGSIPFFGRILEDEYVLKTDSVIDAFGKYLSDDLDEFIKICKMIGRMKIGKVSLVNMRNGLSHGNADIINSIDQDAYYKLRRFLLDAPDSIIVRILSISKK